MKLHGKNCIFVDDCKDLQTTNLSFVKLLRIFLLLKLAKRKLIDNVFIFVKMFLFRHQFLQGAAICKHLLFFKSKHRACQLPSQAVAVLWPLAVDPCKLDGIAPLIADPSHANSTTRQGEIMSKCQLCSNHLGMGVRV